MSPHRTAPHRTPHGCSRPSPAPLLSLLLPLLPDCAPAGRASRRVSRVDPGTGALFRAEPVCAPPPGLGVGWGGGGHRAGSARARARARSQQNVPFTDTQEAAAEPSAAMAPPLRRMRKRRAAGPRGARGLPEGAPPGRASPTAHAQSAGRWRRGGEAPPVRRRGRAAAATVGEGSSGRFGRLLEKAAARWAGPPLYKAGAGGGAPVASVWCCGSSRPVRGHSAKVRPALLFSLARSLSLSVRPLRSLWRGFGEPAAAAAFRAPPQPAEVGGHAADPRPRAASAPRSGPGRGPGRPLRGSSGGGGGGGREGSELSLSSCVGRRGALASGLLRRGRRTEETP